MTNGWRENMFGKDLNSVMIGHSSKTYNYSKLNFAEPTRTYICNETALAWLISFWSWACLKITYQSDAGSGGRSRWQVSVSRDRNFFREEGSLLWKQCEYWLVQGSYYVCSILVYCVEGKCINQKKQESSYQTISFLYQNIHSKTC